MDDLETHYADVSETTASAGDVRPQDETKRVFIRTFGCQMNVCDSERMTESARRPGLCRADDIEQADLAIL